MLREDWLNQAAEKLRPWFSNIGHPLPKQFRVTCGWPSTGALARRKRRIGECWTTASSAGKINEIFISPVISEPVQVVGVLVHELVHAADNCKHGHTGPFTKMCRKLGLVGKPTATAPGPELTERIKAQVLEELPPYPHDPLDLAGRPVRRQTTRMKKVACPECGYTVRTTAKWIEVGLPTCHCGAEMEEAG